MSMMCVRSKIDNTELQQFIKVYEVGENVKID